MWIIDSHEISSLIFSQTFHIVTNHPKENQLSFCERVLQGLVAPPNPLGQLTQNLQGSIRTTCRSKIAKIVPIGNPWWPSLKSILNFFLTERPIDLKIAKLIPIGAGLGGSVGCAVRLETRRSRVQPPPRSATFFRGDWSWNIFYGHSLPSADSRRAVVSFWRKNVHNTG